MPTQRAHTKGRRTRLAATLLDLAQFGIAQWFFGNVYEAVVRMPERLAAQPTDAGSVLAPGSPVRYYAPAVPLTVTATIGALIAGRQHRVIRRWVAVSAGCWLSGAAVTAYLVRTVNLRLFFTTEPPSPSERDALIGNWYRLNVVRTAAAAISLFCAHRARQECVSQLRTE